MLLRYGSSENGTVEKKAHIYTRDEHGLEHHLVDPDALWVCRTLRRARFHAYIVGGAVRDLLVGRKPKDFDIATDATPQQLRRLFRTARLIGRRFRIVHVYFGRDKWVEVTTFRAEMREGSENFFGTMEEDARRRDFTINALYYEPLDEQIVDYVGGLDDVRRRRLRTLGNAEESFNEDPVRMIRALKYASYTGFPITMGMGMLIKRLRRGLLDCSRERVTEEVYKILASGNAADILELAWRYRVTEVLLPAVDASLRPTARKLADSSLGVRLAALDDETRAGRPLEREALFSFLFRDLLLAERARFVGPEPDIVIAHYLRTASEPLFPSRRDLARAALDVLQEIGAELVPPKKKRHRRGGRRRGPRRDVGQSTSGPQAS
ncbi:MAG: polynucleotide adenylyltransferase PcnB [Spirochaetes bacterium]|nr:polynucleotide adenylyltransferase PcnB [Spirochaetota bacterium]